MGRVNNAVCCGGGGGNLTCCSRLAGSKLTSSRGGSNEGSRLQWQHYGRPFGALVLYYASLTKNSGINGF